MAREFKRSPCFHCFIIARFLGSRARGRATKTTTQQPGPAIKRPGRAHCLYDYFQHAQQKECANTLEPSCPIIDQVISSPTFAQRGRRIVMENIETRRGSVSSPQTTMGFFFFFKTPQLIWKKKNDAGVIRHGRRELNEMLPTHSSGIDAKKC